LTSQAEDLAALEALHRRDMAAAKAGDFAALRSIIDDDAVMMAPGGKVQRGRAELDAAFAAMSKAPRTHEVLEYVLDFDEVTIAGDLAFEWGCIRGSMKELATGKVTRSEYHVMRVLRRQADGAWKVYRSIWAPRG
jgi:uncharacterized protein (TIGR02246 family)